MLMPSIVNTNLFDDFFDFLSTMIPKQRKNSMVTMQLI